jgi:cytochrome P450
VSTTGQELFAQMAAKWGAVSVEDPYEFYAQRRREEPVASEDLMLHFGMPSYIGYGPDGPRPVYSVYRYEDVANGLRDHETFVSSLWLDLLGPITGRTILGLDGEEHRRWRGLLLPVFTRRAVESWNEQMIRPAAQRGVRAMREQGNRVDLTAFAQTYPLEVIYQVLGLPVDSQVYDEFERMSLTMLLAYAPETDGSTTSMENAIAASSELFDMLLPIVAARRAKGADGDDLLSQLLRAEFEGRRLDDEQITTFVRSLLPAATDNTSRQLLITAALLFERPDDLAAIREDRSLLANAAIEAERFDGPVAALSRVASREVEIAGVTIPEGAGVSFAVNSANRDERMFENPDQFDIRRQGVKPLTWGLGRHVCPAMNTGRAEIKIALETILDELPDVRLDLDAPPPTIVGVHARSPLSVNLEWN